MDETQFEVQALIFRKIVKCVKDHKCMTCGRTIIKGSTYFYSETANRFSSWATKVCPECLAFNLSLDSPKAMEKNLDK
jgi:hypothetical protein